MTVLERLLSKLEWSGDCLVFTGKAQTYDGYALAWIGQQSETKWKFRAAHRVMWEAFRGPIPEDRILCHSCDNRKCVRLEHLFLGTIQDNMDDRNRKGRQARGERHGKSRLTADEVLEIRRKRAAGALVGDLAREYGLSYSGMQHITSGRKWKHLLPLEQAA